MTNHITPCSLVLNLNYISELEIWFSYRKCIFKRKGEETSKNLIYQIICEEDMLLFVLSGPGRNMATSMKGDSLSSSYKWLILRKRKTQQ